MKLLREPLLYFLIAGTLMFLLTGFMTDDGDNRIVVTEAQQARLAEQWQARMGREPTTRELDALVEQWVRQEIYFREALALGLHENDPVVRRRLVQKLQFLGEGQAAEETADQSELRAYYQKNAERYTAPVRYTFRHRYFGNEREHPEADARQVLRGLEPGESPEGDPFPVQSTHVERWSQRDVAQLFGGDFAEVLADLEAGDWQGPVSSSFGWHLVKLEQKHPAEQLPFEEVAAQVAAHFQEERSRQESAAYYQSLRDKYEVVRP